MLPYVKKAVTHESCENQYSGCGLESQTYADGCVGNICVGLYRQEMKVFIPKSVILC